MSYQNFRVKNGLSVNDVEVIDSSGNLVGPASSTSNSASSYANSAYSQANTAITNASSASSYANSAYAQANASNTLAQSSYNNANTRVSKSGDIMTGSLATSGNIRANNIIANTQFFAGIATESATVLPDLIAQFTGNTDTYVQVNAQNIDPLGSADYVVTADVGDDEVFYIDMGIHGSNKEFGTTKSLDGYLLVQGNTSQLGGNLIIGTLSETPGIETRIIAGGGEEGNVIVRINDSGLIVSKGDIVSNATSRISSHANSSYNQANTGTILAQSAFNAANSISSGSTDETARSSANSASSYANSAYTQANTANTLAQAAYDTANNSVDTWVRSAANSASSYANSAYLQANTATTNAATADQRAVTSGSYANSAFGVANNKLDISGGTVSGSITANNLTANISVKTPTLYSLGSGASIEMTDIGIISINPSGGSGAGPKFVGKTIEVSSVYGGTYGQNKLSVDNETKLSSLVYDSVKIVTGANQTEHSTWNFANSSFIFPDGTTQNTAWTGAASSYANSAYGQANTATTNAATADQRAVTSGYYANAAFDIANTANLTVTSASSYANSAYTQANTATTNAATADQKGVSAGVYANAAFGQANTANLTATSASSYANSAYNQANTASVNATSAGSYANGAFAKANTANTLAQSAFDTANTKFNSTGGTITGFANVSSNLSVGTFIDIATNLTNPTNKEGRLFYDADSKSLAYNNDSSNYIHIGQDSVIRVWNNSGSTLPRANCVFISGQSSANGFPSVFLASADSNANSEVIGLTTTDIANGAYGFALTSGRIEGLNTSLISEGVELFLSASEPGKFTTTVPASPNIPLNIGYVTNSDLTNGIILVNIHLMEGSNKTTGSILFARDNKIDQDNADLYWDHVNLRMGIGTNNPTANLHVVGSGLFTGNVTISGNLLVSNAQAITTSQLTVGGNTIILNDAVTGTPTSNAEIIVNRGTSPNVYIKWAEDINEWVMFEDAGYPEGHIIHSEKTFSTWAQYTAAAAYEKSTHPVGGNLANTTNETAKAGFQTANIASSHAVAGYIQANTASSGACTAQSMATTASLYANGAYAQANTATTNAATADQRAVTSGVYANAAFDIANTANLTATSASSYANSAYLQANTATTNTATADQKAVSAGVYANAAYAHANTKFNTSGGTITGDVLVNGKITANTTGGDEGGEILLGRATSNTTLSGAGVTIDVYQNKLRIFEQGGTARGAFIDLTSAIAGVGTDLLASSSGTDPVARASAQEAYHHANGAYTQANTATTNAATADQKAVSAGSYANSAYTRANTATTNAATADQRAVSSGSYANSAYTQANTATTNAATADQRAVTSGSYANSAFSTANTASLNATSAGSYANGSFGIANTADQRAVTSGVYANSAYSQANTATTNAATADQKAVSAGSYANSAFTVANTATTNLSTQTTKLANFIRNRAAQFTLSGGGLVTWSGTSVLWGTRVIAIPVENIEYGSAGYFDITCPTSGTVTYFNAAGATTTVTATAAGIPLGGWEALFYVITPGQTSTSDATKFRVVNYQNATWSPDENWICLASTNADGTNIGHLRWNPGQVNLPTTGSTVTYNTGTGASSWAVGPTGPTGGLGPTGPTGPTGAASTVPGPAGPPGPSGTITNTAYQMTSLGIGTPASGTTGELRATNNITAFYSDRRLKENIKPITDAVRKVLSISGVKFNSNDLAETYGYTDRKTQVGVIAQEIESVLPEIVVPAPFDIAKNPDGSEYSKSGHNFKTVQYEKIVPLLIEAIKEQQTQIETLNKKIDELTK
jgi:hypothetical protein